MLKKLFGSSNDITLKYSAAGALMAGNTYYSNGKAQWTPRDYHRLSKEGYEKNVVAFRCVHEIAASVAGIPMLLSQDNNALIDHPVLSLLSQPNPVNSDSSFVETVISQLLIAGNAYVEMVCNDAGKPVELWALRPDRMKVVPGKHGLPQAYEYGTGNQVKRWHCDPVTGQSPILHFKYFHPSNDWYGMAPLEACSHAIDQYNTAENWNQALLQNGCRPSGALTVEGISGEPLTLSEDQFDRLKTQLETQYSGAANAGKPILLEGGLKWTEMMLSPKDMDYINIKNSAAREIALAFGYPPMLLGLPGDNTYANQKEARLALYEQTVLPLMRQFITGLEGWLLPCFGENLKLSYDEDAISALHPRRELLWKRIKDADFLTNAEKRAAVGYD